MNEEIWPFSDPPNVAVFADKRIIEGKRWIYYVGHDADDGAWQFHIRDGFAEEDDASVVGLKTIVELEPRVTELSDLPLGWCAWRESKESDWKRAPQRDNNQP